MLALALGLTCLAAESALAAEPTRKYDGVYSGTRSLTKGTASAMCPAEDAVTVSIEGGLLTFTDSTTRKFVEPFQARPDGSFGEIYVNARGGRATVEYHGRIVGNSIDVDVTNYQTNPPCEYHWHLEKRP